MSLCSVLPPRVVFLGISLKLYRDGTPDEYAVYRKYFEEWRERLAAFTEIAASGFACTREEMEEILHRVPSDSVDAVVAAHLSYAVSRPAAEALAGVDLPVVLWNTQQAASFDENYTPQDLGYNHTVQGTQDLTNVLYRRGRKFAIVSGHCADADKNRELLAVLETMRALRQSRRIRTGCIGGRFEEMDDFLFEPGAVEARFGWTFPEIPASDYVRALSGVSDAAVTAELLADRRRFQVSPELPEPIHRDSVRGYLALRALAEDRGLDAFTFNFRAAEHEDIPGGIPFYGINRLLADGYGYAGEGDTLRAALGAAGRLLAGSSNFTEIYTVDFLRNRFMMSHMQECNPAWARRDRRIELRRMPFWLAGRPDYAGMFFTLEPGTVTLYTLTENGRGGYRYVAFTGEIEDMAPLKNYNRAHWVLRVPDAAGLLDRYSAEGGTHHLIVLPGDRMRQLRLLASFQEAEFADVR